MLRALPAALVLAACLLPLPAQAHSRHSECVDCTPVQRDAFRTAEELVQRLWLESRRAHLSVKKEGATNERVQAYLDQLRASFSEAWRAHEAFRATLCDHRTEILSTRLGRIEEVRRNTLDNFDDLEAILGERPPDQTQANWRFGRIVRSMKNWVQQNDRIEWHAHW